MGFAEGLLVGYVLGNIGGAVITGVILSTAYGALAVGYNSVLYLTASSSRDVRKDQHKKITTDVVNIP